MLSFVSSKWGSSCRFVPSSLAFLLHPSEDLKDCLVEVIGLVGENVMARSPDHLTNANTQLNRKRQLFRDTAVVVHIPKCMYEHLWPETHSVHKMYAKWVYSFHEIAQYAPCILFLNHILKRLDMKRQLQKSNLKNLPWFLHLVWFSWMHIQSHCRCWSVIHRWTKWECQPWPGRSSPAWAS